MSLIVFNMFINRSDSFKFLLEGYINSSLLLKRVKIPKVCRRKMTIPFNLSLYIEPASSSNFFSDNNHLLSSFKIDYFFLKFNFRTQFIGKYRR